MLDILIVCLSTDATAFSESLARTLALRHPGARIALAKPPVESDLDAWVGVRAERSAGQVVLAVFGRERPDHRLLDPSEPQNSLLVTASLTNRPLVVVLAPGAKADHTIGISPFVQRLPFAWAEDEQALRRLSGWLDEIAAGSDWRFRPIQGAPPPVFSPDEDVRGSHGSSGAPQAAPDVLPPAPVDARSPPVASAPAATAPGRPVPPPPADASPHSPWVGGVAEPEPVLLGAAAPQTVGPGEEFTARFVAYVAASEEQVREELKGLSPRSKPHLGLKTCQWQPGMKVKVSLTARQLQIQPAAQEFVWEGSRNLIEFDVTVPEDAKPGTVVLKFDASVDGIVVAALRLDLQIAGREAHRGPSSPAASVSGGAAQTAFASYSSEDRLRVLDRVAAVRISAGLDIFLDCMSLHPGKQWQPQLEYQIRNRDLFLLFWSKAAAESEWVSWEWRTAIRERGKEAMQIHPLEVGVKPPEELQDLHFGDPYMLARKAQEPPPLGKG